MVYRILVASYTNDIVTLTVELPEGDGKASISVTSSVTVGHHPSWITRHVSDPSIVFTGLEQEDGRLLTLKYDVQKGEGRVVGNVSSAGNSPCTILATEREVLVGNVRGDTMGICDKC